LSWNSKGGCYLWSLMQSSYHPPSLLKSQRILFIFLLIKLYYSLLPIFCLCLSSFGIIFGDLLDNHKSHLFFYNMSFNFETLALDVEACYTGIGSNIVRIYGFFFEKQIHLHLNYQCKMAYILFEIKFYYTLVNLGLRCCPPNQFFVLLFGHGICPIYKFSLIFYHHGDNIYVIKVIDSIPFINNLNKCRKMKIIR